MQKISGMKTRATRHHQKKYKVLVGNNDSYAVTSVNKHESHITGMYCFNAIGVKLDPFIILPTIENLPNECKDLNAFLTSQKSGWIYIYNFFVYTFQQKFLTIDCN